MKKVFVLFCTLLVLASCNIENLNVESIQEENQEINLNITITRSDINADTKASVKQGWADGDVVFVFFSGVDAPKYLELKYNSSTSEWAATRMKTAAAEKLSFEDIEGAPSLTALYMPYGSQLNVFGSGSSKREFNRYYHGHFYSAENQGFTWDPVTKTLTSTINLAVHAPSAGERLVHFDVEGLDVTNDYYNVLFPGQKEKKSRYFLQQVHMKPLTTNGVKTDGTVAIIDYDFGKEIEGYIDPEGGFVSFSGVLESSAVGNPEDYDFIIYDRIDQKYYYRDDIKNKTISKNMYIGLGDVKSQWKTRSGKFFSVGQTKYVEFSPANLVLNINEVPDGGGTPTVYTWSFHAHQYDFVGADPGSQSGNDGTYNNLTGHGTFATTGRLDSFGWVGASSTVLNGALTRYGVSNSMTDSDYGSTPGESLMSDWGSNTIYSADGNTTYAANYWRTPASGEWEYLFKKRIQASDKFGYETVCGVKGILIIPDLFTDPVTNEAEASSGKFVPRHINKTGWGQNVYTGDNWTAMETAGAIFLPVTYYRDGNKIGRIFHTDPTGFYNSSTAVEGTTNRYYIQTGDSYNGLIKDAVRASGLAVRLIHDLN